MLRASLKPNENLRGQSSCFQWPKSLLFTAPTQSRYEAEFLNVAQTPATEPHRLKAATHSETNDKKRRTVNPIKFTIASQKKPSAVNTDATEQWLKKLGVSSIWSDTESEAGDQNRQHEDKRQKSRSRSRERRKQRSRSRSRSRSRRGGRTSRSRSKSREHRRRRADRSRRSRSRSARRSRRRSGSRRSRDRRSRDRSRSVNCCQHHVFFFALSKMDNAAQSTTL